FAAPKWHSPRFPFVLARSWFSSLPVDLLKHRIPDLRREVSAQLESGSIDLCIADFLFAVPNVPLESNVPMVFFAHNVEHLIWKRLCHSRRRFWMRPLLEVEWRKIRRYETDACRRANLTIAVSPD